MPPCPPWLSLTVLASTWLLSMRPDSASAQLSISVDDDVQLQNGDQPPLVVKPGQAFAGRLTPRGFEGVMSGPAGTTAVKPQAMPANPFRDPMKTTSQPLTIKAGDVALTLPMTTPAMPEKTAKPMLSPQKRDAMRMRLRAEAAKAMPQLDKLMQAHAADADLLQMKAFLLMQMGRHREAAAFVYDAMAMDADALWDWHRLRSTVADREQAVMLYRLLQKAQRDKSSLELDFLMASWEHMLGHREEAAAMMNRAVQARPKDPVFQSMFDRWSAATADTPPATQP
jgi:hypothetical protein